MSFVRGNSLARFVPWRCTAALLVAGLAAGCSSSRDAVALAFVDPGILTYYSCPQLADSERGFLTRKRDLEEVMTKASGDTVGNVVYVAVYQPDYLNVVGSLKVVNDAQKEKNCTPSAGQQSTAAIR
jgi:hypothetical protein